MSVSRSWNFTVPWSCCSWLKQRNCGAVLNFFCYLECGVAGACDRFYSAILHTRSCSFGMIWKFESRAPVLVGAWRVDSMYIWTLGVGVYCWLYMMCLMIDPLIRRMKDGEWRMEDGWSRIACIMWMEMRNTGALGLSSVCCRILIALGGLSYMCWGFEVESARSMTFFCFFWCFFCIFFVRLLGVIVPTKPSFLWIVCNVRQIL